MESFSMRTFLLLRPCSREKLLKRSFHVLIVATTPCRSSARCIPTCSYCIYYFSLPSWSVSPSSLCKVLNIRVRMILMMITFCFHSFQAPAVDVVALGLQNGKVVVHNLKYDETLMSFIQDWGPVTSLAFRTGMNTEM